MITLRSDSSNNTINLFQVNNVENKENGACDLGRPALVIDAVSETYLVRLKRRRDSIIEDDISQCERQIAAPISKMNTLKEGESIDKTWEIIIKNSPQRNMKLELHIQSAADLLDLVNTSYIQYLGSLPRNLTYQHPEPLQAIRVEVRYLRNAIIRVVREAAEIENTVIPYTNGLKTSHIFTTYPSLMFSLVDEFFACRNMQSPIMHRQFYNSHRNTAVGKHLNISIGCMMSIRGCNHSHLVNLPSKMLMELRDYFIAAGTELAQDMMLMEHPPLSFCILMLCLSSAHMFVQKMRKAWLWACPARTYLQQHMSKYIDSSSGSHGRSNPEIETYKYALHYCEKLELRLGAIINARATPSILNIDPKLTLPTKLDGDNEIEHAAFIQQLTWERLVAESNKWLDFHASINDSVKSMDWKAVNKVTRRFYDWYLQLPAALKIGEKPFDINFVDIPKDMAISVCIVQIAFYGEWMIIYSNFLSVKNILEDEEKLVESKKYAFLASRAIIKLAHHVSRHAVCRIEFYWIVFACEPLLYLLNAKDSYIVEESRKSLKVAKDLLRILLSSTNFSGDFGHHYNASHHNIAKNIAKEVATMFSSYGLQF
ncbi:hypothetical protein NQZ79_g2507 [Umbelopsis isabellina]|nr:hypothetical protein NQZ79_g2507 [Umbelopsis isabellina]